MITIGLFEAKAQLGQLVNSAARGEVVVLTRRGQPLAEIRAVRPVAVSGDVTSAIQGLRRWRGRVRAGAFDIAELVAEGRRA